MLLVVGLMRSELSISAKERPMMRWKITLMTVK